MHRWLNDWIMNYVVSNPENAGERTKAEKPLREAKIEVREVKGAGDQAIQAADVLIADLTELDRLDGVVVSSFDDTVIAHVTAIAPNVEVSPGTAATAAFVLDATPLPDGQRILQLPPVFEETDLLTPAIIGAAHDAGYVIWVWPNAAVDALVAEEPATTSRADDSRHVHRR